MGGVDGAVVEKPGEGALDRSLVKLAPHVLDNIILVHDFRREVLHQTDDCLQGVRARRESGHRLGSTNHGRSSHAGRCLALCRCEVL